ncbi:MAG: class I SAM-dependent methyltransferase [Chloroflexi bacterium]|nr:class I SAM-dependent methyltransferase [Chloroflexota bacterium]
MIDAKPVCDYEGSNYQAEFWNKGGRDYEDLAERIALRAMLPAQGRLFLEIGAGAGRLTPTLAGFEHVVLLDYSRTQLQQARARLGDGPRFTYVAANVYDLPFVPGVFNGASMIRVMHHLVDGRAALKEIHNVMSTGGAFILEFANKQNVKAILRYWLRRQNWSPFSPEPVEFVKLNFDFHPRAMREWLGETGFAVEAQRTVSHYRLSLLKRLVPASLLAAADGLFQPTGEWWQLAPSVFVKCRVQGGKKKEIKEIREIFCCPNCDSSLSRSGDVLECYCCGKRWGIKDGIYDFKEPL